MPRHPRSSNCPPDGRPGALGSARGLRAALPMGAAALALVCAACGGAADDAGTSTTAASASATSTSSAPTEAASQSSSSGATSSAASAGGASSSSAETGPVPVTPAKEAPQVPDTCSGDAAFTALTGKPVDGEVPPRDGRQLTITVSGTDMGTSPTAMFTVQEKGDGAPAAVRKVGPARLGDTFALGPWTFSVTSICKDRAGVDLTN